MQFSPDDFSLLKYAACAIFGGIGFVAFVYGKRNDLWRTMLVGAALMVFPYFFSNILAIFLVGFALTALLYFWRD